MYITIVLPYSDSCMYWYLAYVCEGIFIMHIYVTVTSPYSWDQGITTFSQWQVFEQALRREEEGRGRGQVFKLTTEKAKASEEVVTDTILVHSVPVITLFNFGVSHCYISTRIFIMHSISCGDMDTQWEISTENGVITTSRVYKSCFVVVCERIMCKHVCYRNWWIRYNPRHDMAQQISYDDQLSE